MTYFQRKLAGKRAWCFVLLAACVLSLPTVFHGLEMDDRLLRLATTERGDLAYMGRNPPNLFTILDGNVEHTKTQVDLGLIPWWTDMDTPIVFLRILSSIFHWFDYHVLKIPALLHAHSMVWYLGTVLLAWALYRRLFQEAWVAGLAGFMFAVDHAHGLAVEWVAQRNTLIAGFWGLTALYFHDRSRRDEGKRFETSLASCALGLAFFSGESSLAAGAYLLAYAWAYDRPQWFRSLLPYVPPFFLWVLCYKLGGYGAHGSAMYVDPSHAPLAYLGNVLRYGPILFAIDLGIPGAELYLILSPILRVVSIALAVLAIAAFFTTLRSALRTEPVVRFLAFGSLLSVLPSCATVPTPRLVFLTSFGLVGCLALILQAYRDPSSWFAHMGWTRKPSMVIVAFGVGHIFLSPLGFLLGTQQIRLLDGMLVRHASTFPLECNHDTTRAIVVNPPEPSMAVFLMSIRHDQGFSGPAGILSMTSGTRPTDLTRTDTSTLVLSSPQGIVQSSLDGLTRNTRPFAVGDHFAWREVSIEVTRVNGDGVPIEARFAFPEALENASFCWIQWQGRTFAPWTVPQIGETVALPAQALNPL